MLCLQVLCWTMVSAVVVGWLGLVSLVLVPLFAFVCVCVCVCVFAVLTLCDGVPHSATPTQRRECGKAFPFFFWGGGDVEGPLALPAFHTFGGGGGGQFDDVSRSALMPPCHTCRGVLSLCACRAGGHGVCEFGGAGESPRHEPWEHAPCAASRKKGRDGGLP